jgi:hypothetical protein
MDMNVTVNALASCLHRNFRVYVVESGCLIHGLELEIDPPLSRQQSQQWK